MKFLIIWLKSFINNHIILMSLFNYKDCIDKINGKDLISLRILYEIYHPK